MRPILVGLLLFTLLFLLLDLLNSHYHSGITFSAFSTYILGNEEEYIDPISFATLLELLHVKIFLVMMTLLILSAIYARLAPSKKAKYAIHSVMLSAFFSLVGMIASPYVTWAIYLHVILLWLWHIIALAITIESLYRLK